MIEGLTALVTAAEQALFSGFVVFLRIGAVLAVLPAFGESAIPQRVRIGIALAFTIILLPAVADLVRPVTEQDRLIGLFLITEVVIGLSLGIALRLFILALQMAGSMAAQATSLSQIFAGAGVEPMPAVGHLLVVGGLALAVMLGLHVRVVEFLVLSYETLPPGTFPGREILSAWGIGQIARAFALAFALAAPFVIASLIYNVALGVINKAMPQLMVAFVGAPAITAGGLIILFLAAPLMFGVWVDGLDGFFADPFGGQP